MNDYLWTASGTDITIRWKLNGWIPASEQQDIKDKWKRFQELSLRTLEESNVH